MSVKSVLSTVTGFLTHHVEDLNAVSGTLTALLDALPVNAETRAHIETMIEQVRSSASNVAAALENTTFEADPVTIRESDIETALSNVIKSGSLDGVIGQAVAEYALAHPTPAPVAEPASFTSAEAPASAAIGGGATATEVATS